MYWSIIYSSISSPLQSSQPIDIADLWKRFFLEAPRSTSDMLFLYGLELFQRCSLYFLNRGKISYFHESPQFWLFGNFRRFFRITTTTKTTHRFKKMFFIHCTSFWQELTIYYTIVIEENGKQNVHIWLTLACFFRLLRLFWLFQLSPVASPVMSLSEQTSLSHVFCPKHSKRLYVTTQTIMLTSSPTSIIVIRGFSSLYICQKPNKNAIWLMWTYAGDMCTNITTQIVQSCVRRPWNLESHLFY